MKEYIILFSALIVVSLPTSVKAQSMQDYTSNPVFTTTDIIPNVLFVIDSSSSMH